MKCRVNAALAIALSCALALASCGLEGQPPKPDPPRAAHRPSVPGVHGLVTSGHPLASMAGMQVLLKGGNAIDASVAVLATLNVVRPQMSGAGGNGFMTIYEKETGKVYSLSATGAAPKALNPDQVTDEDLAKGIKAGVVPGLFGGWVASLERFGTMSLGELLRPAIDYAETGHPIEASVVGHIGDHRDLFEKFGSSRSAFFPQGRMPIAN
jgi:gamma-glutamyltranspeptidase/glutathione hydrolase